MQFTKSGKYKPLAIITIEDYEFTGFFQFTTPADRQLYEPLPATDHLTCISAIVSFSPQTGNCTSIPCTCTLPTMIHFVALPCRSAFAPDTLKLSSLVYTPRYVDTLVSQPSLGGLHHISRSWASNVGLLASTVAISYLPSILYPPLSWNCSRLLFSDQSSILRLHTMRPSWFLSVVFTRVPQRFLALNPVLSQETIPRCLEHLLFCICKQSQIFSLQYLFPIIVWRTALP